MEELLKTVFKKLFVPKSSLMALMRFILIRQSFLIPAVDAFTKWLKLSEKESLCRRFLI